MTDYTNSSIYDIVTSKKLKKEERLAFLVQYHNMEIDTARQILNFSKHIKKLPEQIAATKLSKDAQIFLLKYAYKMTDDEIKRLYKRAITLFKEKISKQKAAAKAREERRLIRQINKEEREKLKVERIRKQVRQKLLQEEFRRIPEDERIRFISDEVKEFVWRRDRAKCVKCGSQNNLEFDHIIPFSKGGSNTARNIQLLCERCNRAKKDRI